MTLPLVPTSLPEDFQKPNEADLIAAAKKDPKEFGQIYHLYIQSIFRYLYSRIGSLPDAEDATAQTFLAALEALDRYQHRGHLAAWLFAIARQTLSGTVDDPSASGAQRLQTAKRMLTTIEWARLMIAAQRSLWANELTRLPMLGRYLDSEGLARERLLLDL